MLGIIAYTALTAGDFDRACTLMDEVMALLPELPNPDVVSRRTARQRSSCT